jgi:ABC-type polysaccharide/polyol phosphate transport system ATPase subunit
MSSKVIEVEHISKLFYRQEQRTFKEFVPALFLGKKTRQWFWALNDVSFSVNRGDMIGIVGPNGSGKSTLLKIIAGVSKPTKGNITLGGKVAPLIELGAGFHPELTGRENVFLNGVILGMKRKEIQEKFNTIVDFAELWEFIDAPVKHYSSGMYLRLGFSVAVHTNPEILLVDEILAVGDKQFQKKCLDRIEELRKSGVTIVFVSHSQEQVERFCNKVYSLEKGVGRFYARTKDAFKEDKKRREIDTRA